MVIVVSIEMYFILFITIPINNLHYGQNQAKANQESV
jgi:hypothetical protein